jgi:hypothetical protein
MERLVFPELHDQTFMQRVHYVRVLREKADQAAAAITRAIADGRIFDVEGLQANSAKAWSALDQQLWGLRALWPGASPDARNVAKPILLKAGAGREPLPAAGGPADQKATLRPPRGADAGLSAAVSAPAQGQGVAAPSRFRPAAFVFNDLDTDDSEVPATPPRGPSPEPAGAVSPALTASPPKSKRRRKRRRPEVRATPPTHTIPRAAVSAQERQPRADYGIIFMLGALQTHEALYCLAMLGPRFFDQVFDDHNRLHPVRSIKAVTERSYSEHGQNLLPDGWTLSQALRYIECTLPGYAIPPPLHWRELLKGHLPPDPTKLIVPTDPQSILYKRRYAPLLVKGVPWRLQCHLLSAVPGTAYPGLSAKDVVTAVDTFLLEVAKEQELVPSTAPPFPDPPIRRAPPSPQIAPKGAAAGAGHSTSHHHRRPLTNRLRFCGPLLRPARPLPPRLPRPRPPLALAPDPATWVLVPLPSATALLLRRDPSARPLRATAPALPPSPRPPSTRRRTSRAPRGCSPSAQVLPPKPSNRAAGSLWATRRGATSLSVRTPLRFPPPTRALHGRRMPSRHPKRLLRLLSARLRARPSAMGWPLLPKRT